MASIEEKIREAVWTQATSLDLSGSGLRSLPLEILQLTQLCVLDLDGNQLTGIPAEILQLTQLQYLYLTGNQLTEIPAGIGQLTQLQDLRLDGNQLTEIPAEIGQLTQLKYLDLDGNQLTELPTEIGQLTQLRFLHLDGNQLTELPTEIGQLTQLRFLHLDGNDRLGLPPEVLGRPSKPAEILEFYFRSRTGASRALLEAKILIVGQGTVGKTSLARRLVEDTFDADEARTEGINIVRWQVPGNEPASEIRVNVWDFGGQEIMHATHQFFLTRRSLYLLVLDARKGENESNLYYWLRFIQSFGGEAPVLVVTNKYEPPQLLELNETRLAKDYAPNIRGFFRTSCQSGDGVEELRAAITQEIQGLGHVYDQVPTSFLATKKILEERTESKEFLELTEYQEICQDQGIDKASDQGLLLRFLHDLGSVLQFSDPDSPYPLEETKILNPEWVTGGVYKILNSNELMQRGGVLTLSLLEKILTRQDGYPKNGRLFIVGMMRKFELCFDFGDGSNRLLVPELLSPKEPDLGLDEEDALRFEVHYGLLPDGILPRFIVRTHAHLTAKPTYWRSGVLLNIDGNRALVRGDTRTGRVYLAVFDGQPGRRRALSVLRAVLKGIHKTIPGLEVKEMVALPGYPGRAVEYEHLRWLEEEGERTCSVAGVQELFDVRELLNGVEARGEREETWNHQGDVIMGDKYEIRGQAGAVGRKAKAEGNTFQQIYQEAAKDLDLPKLADELLALRKALQQEASEESHYQALAEISGAEKAARDGDGSKALQRLKAAGQWSLDAATKIGVAVAGKAIQAAMGL